MRMFLRFLKSCNTGVALIEFAFALPIILIMLVGIVELTHFIIINQKLDKISTSMADFVTQGTSVGATQLNSFSQAVPQIMRPYTFTGTIVFSSVANFNVATPPCSAGISCISWQHSIMGGDPSQIGAVGGAATLPAGYTALAGQNVIVAEAIMHYTPLLNLSINFIPAFTAQNIYKVAVFKPRQGTLTTLGP